MKPSDKPSDGKLDHAKICEMVGETLSTEQAEAFCHLFHNCTDRCQSCHITIENVDCMIAAYRRATDSYDDEAVDSLHQKLRYHLQGHWEAAIEGQE